MYCRENLMPNKKKYKAIVSNPIRYKKYLEGKRNWIKINRSKYPFEHFSKDFYHRNKIKISPFQFWSIAKRQKLICPLTGRYLNGDIMSIDHKIPISKGGTHEISNLQFVHVEVNYAKRNLLQMNFIKLCKEVAEYNK
jgi:5-methylcytosine-specific restriction endonuclease McrA